MKRILIILLSTFLLFTACNKPADVEKEKTEDAEVVDKAEEERKKKEAEEKKKKEEEERQAAEEAKRLEELKNAPKSPISGLPVDKEVLNNRVIGFMIDNHVQARPQSGLSKAETIYEYEVESNITRYLALFLANDVESIGPVRSLRPYFINSLMEYDGIITRYGGSDDADYDVYDLGIDEIDGMKVAGSYIWRDSSKGKVAPHNAYSSTSAARQAAENMGFHSGRAKGVFEFNLEDTTPKGEPATRVFLNFSSSTAVEFKYDENTKTYDRYVAGTQHVDELDGTEIKAKNIVIQLVEMGYYPNGVHRTVGNIGSGKGYYISDGIVTEIEWSKADRQSKTEYKDSEGNPLKLNPGQTWVEMFNLAKEYVIE